MDEKSQRCECVSGSECAMLQNKDRKEKLQECRGDNSKVDEQSQSSDRRFSWYGCGIIIRVSGPSYLGGAVDALVSVSSLDDGAKSMHLPRHSLFPR